MRKKSFSNQFEIQWQATPKPQKHELQLEKENQYSNLFAINYEPFPLFTEENRIEIKIKFNLVSKPIKPYLHNGNI